MKGKRRLPLWMAGISTADKVSKSLDEDSVDIITKVEVSVLTECTKPKSTGRTGKRKKEVRSPSDETNVLVKCETKRKKRGVVEKDVIDRDDNVQEVVKKKKRGRVGSTVEESDPSRKKEEKCNEFESRDENEASSHDEDDEDLTMDDMLSIAKEFVENDGDMDQWKPSGHCELKSKSLYNSSSMTATSSIVPQDTRPPIHEETASHHNSIENLTSKVTLVEPRMTGDPAQDMLDLFLGPLLKKPIQTEEASSISKDIILPHDVKNQEHDIISDKPVNFVKKKSSLRDAVAMLLD